MKTLKVFGGDSFINGNQGRVICASYTKKHAIEMLEVSVSYFRDYFGETGNERELSIAKEVGVWHVRDSGGHEISPVRLK